MNISLKIKTFKVTVEPILLYESETWTINVYLRKKNDGCYTRLLRMAFNISWKEKLTNDKDLRNNKAKTYETSRTLCNTS